MKKKTTKHDEEREQFLEAAGKKIMSIARSRAFQDMINRQKELIDSWRYGKTGGIEGIVSLADQLREIRGIDAEETKANPSDSDIRALVRRMNAEKLAAWNARVKDAVDKGDREFFKDVAKAIELAQKSENPPAAWDAQYWAVMFADDFRSKGIEPTKQQVREAVEKFRDENGRNAGTVTWQDIWKHPDLAGLKDGKRGRKTAEPIPCRKRRKL